MSGLSEYILTEVQRQTVNIGLLEINQLICAEVVRAGQVENEERHYFNLAQVLGLWI